MFKLPCIVDRAQYFCTRDDIGQVLLAIRYDLANAQETSVENALYVPVACRRPGSLRVEAIDPAFFDICSGTFPTTKKKPIKDDSDDEEEEIMVDKPHVSVAGTSQCHVVPFGDVEMTDSKLQTVVLKFSTETRLEIGIIYEANDLVIPTKQKNMELAVKSPLGEPDCVDPVHWNHMLFSMGLDGQAGMEPHELLKNMRHRHAIGSFNVIMEPEFGVSDIIKSWPALQRSCIRRMQIVGIHSNADIVF